MKRCSAAYYQNTFTAWKVSKYGVFSGPYFPVFGLNTGFTRKSRYSVRIQENADQKKTPYLGTFYTLLFLKTPLKGCVWSLFDIDKLTDLNQSFIKFVLFNIGILVDHLKGTEFSNRSDTDLYLYHDHSFSAEESTYGLLVKDHQDYQYFSSIVRDNRRLIAACINSRFRAKKVRSAKHNNFSLKVD